MDNISTESEPIELLMINSSLLWEDEENVLNLTWLNKQRPPKQSIISKVPFIS